MVKKLLGYVLVETDCRVEWKVLLGLNKLKSVSNVWDRRDSEETLTQQVGVAHILYCSLNKYNFLPHISNIYDEPVQILQTSRFLFLNPKIGPLEIRFIFKNFND